jgi:hypothetical protein
LQKLLSHQQLVLDQGAEKGNIYYDFWDDLIEKNYWFGLWRIYSRLLNRLYFIQTWKDFLACKSL